MKKTIAEKILSIKSQKDARADDIVKADVDFVLSQDGTSSLVIDSFLALGNQRLKDPSKYALIIDHSVPSPNFKISNIHKKMKKFAADTNANIFKEGTGVCHQVVIDEGFAYPSRLIAGADSHTCTYGALNCFSTGMGSTDIAIILAAGRNWFKVPQTVKIVVKGKLPEGVFSKDIILHIIGALGASSCTYKAIEFEGEAVSALSMDSRFTITNMAVEMGAKAGLMQADGITLQWLSDKVKDKFEIVMPDSGAEYEWVKEFDISSLEPCVAKPHHVDNVSPVDELKGTKVDKAYIGTCTNGRLEDLEIAAKVLRGKNVKIPLVIAPASRRILKEALKRNLIETFVSSGAMVLPPGCGPCVGTHGGVPADGEVVISTANRNFKGRMGNPDAFIYLASPATAAASAVNGEITDPRKYLED